ESQKLFQIVLNSISHELRTPISVITTAVSAMDDEKTASNPVFRREICKELNTASMRLNILVENILDMSRIESGYLSLNLQLYEVDDLMGTILNELSDEPYKQVIKLTVDEQLPMVRIDINWFKQAIINVLRNAIMYTPPDSVIDIHVFRTTDKQVAIEISDNGPGIPEDAVKKIFDKFYRVPGSKSGGSGLGLTITKAIVEAHSGQIFAENKQDGGLRFLILLTSIQSDAGQQV
ncbi:MAG: ATP-binding protein, partial [Bacteroidota bacterium]|nr:ATP-binding protein [Bacteroidota bacterium]